MNFYKIVFADGSEIQEYGDSEEDVRGFLGHCYKGRLIREVVQL